MNENNDYYNGSYGPGPSGAYRRPNSMARASLSLGIFSVIFSSLFYIALPCGALAILCALLSRTAPGRPMAKRCRAAVVSGVIGITVSLVITGVAVHTTLTDPQLRAYLEYVLQAYTGDSSLQIEDVLPFADRFFPSQDDDSDTSENDASDGNGLPEDFGDDSLPGNGDYLNDSPQNDGDFPNDNYQISDGKGVFL